MLENLLEPSTARQLRENIGAAGGNEIFVAVRFSGDKVRDIVVDDGSNRHSVPVNEWDLQPGDLVLHNHPSGNLTPSAADLALASRLAQGGVGFVIVDNNVANSYVVVEPAQQQPHGFFAGNLVREALGPSGCIAQTLKDYECREQQLAMAEAIVFSLNNREHVLVEAGTGTGKSLAYLVPAIMWALEHGTRFVISTNTINLQEQLLHKDIPLLQRALPQNFKAVLVKGRNNYLCRRKLYELVQRGEGLVEDQDRDDLSTLMVWEAKTCDGTLSDLGFTPRPELWELVNSDGDVCLRLNCRQFNRCFFHQARREAASAQILIVNHSLLFADIALRAAGADTGVLPRYNGIIFDEAHNIEAVATEWFGLKLTRLGMVRQLGKLYSPAKGGTRGMLPVLERKLLGSGLVDNSQAKAVSDFVHGELVPNIIRATEAVNRLFDGALAFVDQLPARDKVRLTCDVAHGASWQKVVNEARVVAQQLQVLSEQLASLLRRLERLGPAAIEATLAQALEIGAIAQRVKSLGQGLVEVAMGTDQNLVRWLELYSTRRGNSISFHYAPLTVKDLLRRNIWERFPTAVLTSATLSVDRSFAYIRGRLGLDGDLAVKEVILASPFDYSCQVMMGIATDLPAPDQRGYMEQIVPALRATLTASDGRALVLFTSFSLLRSAEQGLREDLESRGITLLCQGQMPRHRLLEVFKSDCSSVLLATASFWEGVDVVGDSLVNLVLTRLPFMVPDDPVTAARIEKLRADGHNPFYSFQIPQAVLRFKQGIGRLIRSSNDYGVITVLDKRLVARAYGKIFLQSLPPCPIVAATMDRVAERQREFLAKKIKPRGTLSSSSH